MQSNTKYNIMKRFHVHLKVNNLEESIQFYNTLFNTQATKVKSDYAKWMLEDPKINFAISTGEGCQDQGIQHLGLQVDNSEELQEVYSQLKKAEGQIKEECQTTCCYAVSDKSWIEDPQSVRWEVFQTHGESTVYGNKNGELEVN